MYYIYVLRNKEGKQYIGQTNNLSRRVIEHNSGFSRYTKKKGPWTLKYSEEYKTRSEAMRREKYFKTGVGREYISSVIESAAAD